MNAFRLPLVLLFTAFLTSNLCAQGGPAAPQPKLAAASLDMLQGEYSAKMQDLFWLFPEVRANKNNARKNVTISVRLAGDAIRFEAVAPGEPVHIKEYPVAGNWDKAASELTISRKDRRGFIHEDFPPGYAWSTDTVKVFLNERHAMVVEHEFVMRYVGLWFPPARTIMANFYREFPVEARPLPVK